MVGSSVVVCVVVLVNRQCSRQNVSSRMMVVIFGEMLFISVLFFLFSQVIKLVEERLLVSVIRVVNQIKVFYVVLLLVILFQESMLVYSISMIISRVVSVGLIQLVVKIYIISVKQMNISSRILLCDSLFSFFSLCVVYSGILLLIFIFGGQNQQVSSGIVRISRIFSGRKVMNQVFQEILMLIMFLISVRVSRFGVKVDRNIELVIQVVVIVIYIRQELILCVFGLFGFELYSGGRLVIIGQIVFLLCVVLDGVNGVSSRFVKVMVQLSVRL